MLDVLKIFVLILVALLPTIIFGFVIYKKDVIEKESFGLLLKIFFFGILSVGVSLFLELNIEEFITFDNSILSTFIYSFFVIALCEEVSKWFLVYVLCWREKEFNYSYDAIVYCTYMALGFATVENIVSVMSTNGGFALAVERGVITMPVHVFFGIISGYYLGLAKKSKRKKTRYVNLFLSFVLPIIVHGFFDFLLFLPNSITFIMLLVLIMSLYLYSVYIILKVSKEKKKIAN